MIMTFLDRLRDRRPLLADGAMGTQLHGRGLPIDTCFDQLNLTRPELIMSIHRDYIAAGADIIETNTFGANRVKLAEHGLDEQVTAINRAGVLLARGGIASSETARPIYVAGSVGPLGVGVQPFGRLKPEEARAHYAEQIAALTLDADGQRGVDLLIFETFTDVDELQLAIRVARAVAPSTPVIAQLTFAADDRTLSGCLPGRAAKLLLEAGADAVGVNCGAGPAQISPVDYFADYAHTFRASGARIIGGCCGTTPAHIAAMRAALDAPLTDMRARISVISGVEADDTEIASHSSELAAKLKAGRFVVSVEMNPPRSHNLERTLEAAEKLREAGADVLNIADSPTARMRISPWAVCQMIETRLGIETILHFPTRGRNLLRIQGDLLGAHALGIRNLFVCMGDPTRIGDYPDAMDNYDIVPSGLIRLIAKRMNAGVDQAGSSIGGATAFTVGCALNMGAQDADKEIEVLLKKIDAGADFALSQPVFDPRLAEQFLRRYEQLAGTALSLPVLMGVMPLHSLRHAQFLNNEIPGISIPDRLLKRIADAEERAPDEGIAIAQELMTDLRGMVQGAYIIPSFGKYELVARLIQQAAPI
jgi:methionine synthase I (cobalamin-dependent)/5,10-methylenetetrahydrofolate reductase